MASRPLYSPTNYSSPFIFSGDPGEAWLFDGARCIHWTLENEEAATRVSLDLRLCIVPPGYQLGVEGDNAKLGIGSCRSSVVGAADGDDSSTGACEASNIACEGGFHCGCRTNTPWVQPRAAELIDAFTDSPHYYAICCAEGNSCNSTGADNGDKKRTTGINDTVTPSTTTRGLGGEGRNGISWRRLTRRADVVDYRVGFPFSKR
jgi:hypothetical protein